MWTMWTRQTLLLFGCHFLTGFFAIPSRKKCGVVANSINLNHGQLWLRIKKIVYKPARTMKLLSSHHVSKSVSELKYNAQSMVKMIHLCRTTQLLTDCFLTQ